MALLIIGMLSLGLYMVDLPFDMEKLNLYGWHKEFGALVLMLVILRLVWKLRNINPILPTHMPAWQIDAKDSSINFTATQNGAPVTGQFKNFSGSLNFDPNQLSTSQVQIKMDTYTANKAVK